MSTGGDPKAVAATVAWQWKRRVDDVCNRFEDAWSAGPIPRLEDYLDDPHVSTARRAALLAELLKLERELRQKRGDRPETSEYLGRFPTYATVVRSVFGEDRVGEYDLIAPIGEGGMGVVYHARHRRIGREVALKMIRPYCLDDAAAVDRFRLEAHLAARLEHDHIVTVYEAGFADGHHYYAMRYIVGQSLAEAIGKKPMAEDRAARVLEQVARAVDFAHTRDVLHRDLKPRNILIDGLDRAFVTDFGLAKALNVGTGATRSDERLGTPPYMSPEQVRDPSRAGVASDVYSLGATLYEALTGRPPFLADNPLEVYRQVLDVEPTPPRGLNRGCSRDLETICLKCLEKEPGRRYATALQLAEDLARFRARAPILARRVGPVERMSKLAGRYPTAAALVAVSVFAAVALGGVIQARRSNAVLERSYGPARHAVDALAQFTERRLGDQPRLKSEALKIVLDYYDDYLKQRGHDPAIADELAATFTRVARLTNSLGERSRALTSHQQALKLRRELVRRLPGDRRQKISLAETLHDIGVLQRGMGERQAAIAAYREALAIREGLVASDPACQAFLHDPSPRPLSPGDRALIGDLARSHGYIGDWEREEGRRDAANRSYQTAQALRARLVATDPTDLLARFQLARSENNAGILDREDGRPEAAIAAQRRAEALQRELVAIGPDSARTRLDEQFLASGRVPDVEFDDFRTDLAATYNYLGVLLSENGQIDPARDSHYAAQELYDTLATEHPALRRWDGDRAWTSTYIGELLDQTPDLDEGRRLFEALLAADPSVPRLRAGLARNAYARGESARKAERVVEARSFYETARAEQARLVAEQPRNFDFHADLGRTDAALAALGPAPDQAQTLRSSER